MYHYWASRFIRILKGGTVFVIELLSYFWIFASAYILWDLFMLTCKIIRPMTLSKGQCWPTVIDEWAFGWYLKWIKLDESGQVKNETEDGISQSPTIKIQYSTCNRCEMSCIGVPNKDIYVPEYALADTIPDFETNSLCTGEISLQVDVSEEVLSVTELSSRHICQ